MKPSTALRLSISFGTTLLFATLAFANGFTDAEVRKVDQEAGRITLKHGPIENLGMPGMTMVFKSKSPEMLKSVKPGDKIRFSAEKVGESFVVTVLETLK